MVLMVQEFVRRLCPAKSFKDPEQILAIANQGMPRETNTFFRGKLLVKIVVKWPAALPEEVALAMASVWPGSGAAGTTQSGEKKSEAEEGNSQKTKDEDNVHLLEAMDMQDFGKPMEGEVDHHDKATRDDELSDSPHFAHHHHQSRGWGREGRLRIPFMCLSRCSWERTPHLNQSS